MVRHTPSLWAPTAFLVRPRQILLRIRHRACARCVCGDQVVAPFFDCSVGLPLFWQERKTVAFTKQLLQDAMAAAVFDLTPGSGACGRACFELGIPYSCLARSPEHGS